MSQQRFIYTLHNLHNGLLVRMTFMAIAAALVFILGGCGSASPEDPNAAPMGAVPSGPTEISLQGSTVKLAKEILTSNVNPFLNKLPITVEAQLDTELNPPGPINEGLAELPPELPPDPFEGLTLVGIAYQPNNAYALLSSAEGTQVLRQGDLLGQLKVSKITQNSVTLSNQNEKQTLLLPDIVGYSQKSSANGQVIPAATDRRAARENTTTRSDSGSGNDVSRSAREAMRNVVDSTRKLRPGEINDGVIQLEEPATEPKTRSR